MRLLDCDGDFGGDWDGDLGGEGDFGRDGDGDLGSSRIRITRVPIRAYGLVLGMGIRTVFAGLTCFQDRVRL